MEKYLEKINTLNMHPKDWEYMYQYNTGYYGKGGSPGSSLKNTTHLIKWLVNFAEKNNINSILDIGCGDLQWMLTFLKHCPYIKYTGLDCVSSILDNHIKKFPTLNFIHKDVYEELFSLEGNFDLVFCKDVIHHRMYDTSKLINNLNKISAKIFIIVYPEYLSIPLDFPEYKWITTYLADEFKSICIKVQ